MKIVILILLMGLSVYVGYMMSLRYRKRVKFMKDLVRFCDETKSNILFGQYKLIEIVDTIKPKCSKDFGKLLDLFEIYLKNSYNEKQLYQDANKYLTYLSSSELQTIVGYLTRIGTVDVEGEINNCNNYRTVFMQYRDSAESEDKKMSLMCIKLGALFGALLVVIFI